MQETPAHEVPSFLEPVHYATRGMYGRDSGYWGMAL